MRWQDVVLDGVLAGTAALFWWRTAHVWGRRTSPESRQAARLAAVGPGRAVLAIALVTTDMLAFFVAMAAADLAGGSNQVTRLADGVMAATALALPPLLVLWYTTGRYGRPTFLVPPMGARRRARQAAEGEPR